MSGIQKAAGSKKLRYDILVFVLTAIVTAAIFLFFRLTAESGRKVVVTVSGEVYGEYSLDQNAEYVISGVSGGTNTLVIEDGYAYLREATCPDKLCVKKGKINTSVESIVCLPNEVVVSISADEAGTEVTDDNGLDAVAS